MDIQTLAENRVMDLIEKHGLVEAIECLSTDATYKSVEKVLGDLLINHYKANEYLTKLYLEKNQVKLEAELQGYPVDETRCKVKVPELFKGTTEALGRLTIRRIV
jgi:hypothetical protein